MRGRIRTVVVAALLLAALPVIPARAEAGMIPCRGTVMERLREGSAGAQQREIVRLRTFYVDAAPQAKSFKIGTKAKVDVTVTRPAHEDPLEQDVAVEPPTSVPAENVFVGIGVHVGDVFVPGFGITDSDGKVVVSLKLPTYMKPGTASVAAYAWNVVHESPCLRVEEDGFSSYPEAFQVTR